MNEQTKLRVRTTPDFKLTDKKDNDYVALDLKNAFGFVPETIIIQKTFGTTGTFKIHAVLTKEEIDKLPILLQSNGELHTPTTGNA